MSQGDPCVHCPQPGVLWGPRAFLGRGEQPASSCLLLSSGNPGMSGGLLHLCIGKGEAEHGARAQGPACSGLRQVGQGAPPVGMGLISGKPGRAQQASGDLFTRDSMRLRKPSLWVGWSKGSLSPASLGRRPEASWSRHFLGNLTAAACSHIWSYHKIIFFIQIMDLTRI